MLMDDVSPDVDDSRWAVVEPNTYWGHWFTDEPTQGYLFDALDEAFKLLDTREPFDGGFYASVAPAHAALRAGIAQARAPLGVDISAIGHAHLYGNND